MDLEGKKILFFAPRFFGYENFIKLKLVEYGAIVEYFDERPANGFWTKAFIRINKRFLYYKIKLYYNKISKKVNNNVYDYVFVINIEAMPKKFLLTLKSKQINASFILYMWDSFLNKKQARLLFQYFDKVFSFDRFDCIKYKFIKFRPLFFIDEYREIGLKSDYEYDFTFIGTAHSDRYSLIQKILFQLDSIGAKSFLYLYLQSKKLYFWNKITNINYKKASINDFKYNPMPQKSVLDIIGKSKIILDIAHPQQAGLTMRTIEMVGANRKLVTTNKDILNYDFYTPNNILVVDRKEPTISINFVHSDYKQINSDIYNKYSIDGWLQNIFE